MKTVAIKYIFASLLLIGILSSCHKDDEGFAPIPDPDEINYTSNIYGVVTTEGNEFVEDAVVTFKGITAITDKNGVYTFKDVEVGDQHNVVKIIKEGYFENARTFRSAGPSTQYQRSILIKKEFDQSFLSSQESTITKDQVSITFPSNSIVIESTGVSYSGEVLIALKTIDPTEERLAELMSGDMTARDDDNSLSTLRSFGMVHVELQSPSGEKLQIGEGKSVQMSYVVSQQFLSDAPSSLDMWSFDYDLGIWIKEGKATLEGNVYTGSVSHFSFWNYDAIAPSVLVTGKVISGQIDFPFYHVSLLNADNVGGQGTTDSEGFFAGRVQAGVELKLTIYSYVENCLSPIIQTTVGPFFEDTDLGIFEAEEINGIEYLTIKGTAVDCNLEPVKEGDVRILNISYPIEDGIIDLTIPFCTTTELDLVISDRVNFYQTTLTQLEAPGDHNLNEVVVCEEGIDHIVVDNLFSIELEFLDDLGMYKIISALDDQVGVLEGNFIDDIISVNCRMGFYMSNGFDPKDFEEKTYSYDYIFLGWTDDLGNTESWSMATGQTGELTIERIIDITTDEKRAEGVFSVECTESTTGEVKTFTGSFAMTYNE